MSRAAKIAKLLRDLASKEAVPRGLGRSRRIASWLRVWDRIALVFTLDSWE